MKKTRKAFTLIEMVIVLFIISLLLLIMIPNLVQQKDHANSKSEEAFRTTLVTQAGLYLENNYDKGSKENNTSTNTADKSDGKVTIKELEDGKYITHNQALKAEKLGIDEATTANDKMSS